MPDRPGLQRNVEADLVAGPDDQLGGAAPDVEYEGRALVPALGALWIESWPPSSLTRSFMPVMP